tara:strand:+ start:363 stop:761 length:399 start_codon:yes stop_codon:yes gene_type:complete
MILPQGGLNSHERFVDDFMSDWHQDNDLEYTELDREFYVDFMSDFDESRNPSRFNTIEEYEEYWRPIKEKRMEEIERRIKEKHQHDEYIESLNHKEWGFIDHLRAFIIDGRPRKKKIKMVKNPNYIGPRSFD